MNKKCFLVLVALVTIGCGGAVDEEGPGRQGSEKVKNSNLKDGPIVIFGDSLAYGTGSNRKKITGQATLDKCFADATGRLVLNLGSEGATSEDALSWVDLVIGKVPSIVIVSIGGNDVIHNKYMGNFPEQKTFKNVKTIYKKLVDAGALVVQIGLNPPDKDSGRLPRIVELADEAGVMFVGKTMEGMWNNANLMSDQVHPNDRGYDQMCDRLLKAMGRLNY